MASPEIGRQLRALRLVNDGLRRVGVRLLYELLVPAAQNEPATADTAHGARICLAVSHWQTCSSFFTT